MNEKDIFKFTKTSFVLLGVSITVFFIIFSQLIFLDQKPENFGVVGDAVGGIMNPIIAIAAALLTFLAFYIQKKANDQIRLDQKFSLLHKNYLDRLNLIIKEIDNFQVSFYNHTMIHNLNEIRKMPNSKKYNFSGLQGITLFLEEYGVQRENILNQNKVDKNFNIDEYLKKSTYNALLLQINNLIILLSNTISEIENTKFSEDENDDIVKEELYKIVIYICCSKFDFIFTLCNNKFLFNEAINIKIQRIKNFYIPKL